MKKVYLFYLCFFAAVLIGLGVYHDNGTVQIHYRQWLIETRLWFALVAILVFALLLHCLLKLLSTVAQGPHKFRQLMKRRHHRQQLTQAKSGLIALSEGQWQLAQKKLSAALSQPNDNSLVNYLGAARAAQGTKDLTARDHYLSQADQQHPDARVIILFTKTELQIESADYQAARQTLSTLQPLVPYHPRLLKLSYHVLNVLGETEALRKLLPQMVSQGLISESEHQQQSQQLLLISIKKLSDVHTTQQTLTKFWQGLSRSQQHDSSIVTAYVQVLTQHNCINQSENLLSQVLKRHYDDDLVLLLGQLEGGKPEHRLSILQQLAKHHPSSHQLLLAMGRQAKQLQLWGRSKIYLEQSIDLQPTTEACLALGQLMNQLGMHEEASQYFEKGLSLKAEERLTIDPFPLSQHSHKQRAMLNTSSSF